MVLRVLLPVSKSAAHPRWAVTRVRLSLWMMCRWVPTTTSIWSTRPISNHWMYWKAHRPLPSMVRVRQAVSLWLLPKTTPATRNRSSSTVSTSPTKDWFRTYVPWLPMNSKPCYSKRHVMKPGLQVTKILLNRLTINAFLLRDSSVNRIPRGWARWCRMPSPCNTGYRSRGGQQKPRTTLHSATWTKRVCWKVCITNVIPTMPVSIQTLAKNWKLRLMWPVASPVVTEIRAEWKPLLPHVLMLKYIMKTVRSITSNINTVADW